MTKLTSAISIASLAFVLSCGDNNKSNIDAAPDVPDEQVDDGFRQVEQLARPGINEALIITQDFLNGYNATAPSFAGVPSSTLTAVVTEAKVVLQALYLGTCLLNGVAGQTAASGLKPAGMTCHAVGEAVWDDNSAPGAADGVTLTAASVTAAKAYADKVFAQFIPDVMRIDVTVTPSKYETPCSDLNAAPLLCGGRWLRDDVIDTTYDYLLNGVGSASGAGVSYTQFSALVSDGVNFLPTTANVSNRTPSVTTNAQQFHPDVSDAFPYSAPPL